MTEKTILQQISNLAFDIQHTDDLQESFDKAAEILKLTESDHQPTFEVGEYYVNKLGDIIKIRSIESGTVYYDYLKKGGNKILVTQGVDSQLNFSPATSEQIATFKRAEHFASKGREWSEFKKGDIVQNTKTMQLGLVESVDEDGDALVNYNIDEPLIYPSCCKCTGALFLNLIQAAEELREVENDD